MVCFDAHTLSNPSITPMKITGGFLKNKKLLAPKGLKTRPTSEKLRQTVFNICQNQIQTAHFLDLFAGSGAMGIEALSRGACSATFVEKDRSALQTIRHNLNNLHICHLATILAGDVFSHLKKLKERVFDLIYLDPPYEHNLYEKSVQLIDQFEMVSEGGILFIEERTSKEFFLNNLKLKKRKTGSSFLYQFNPR